MGLIGVNLLETPIKKKFCHFFYQKIAFFRRCITPQKDSVSLSGKKGVLKNFEKKLNALRRKKSPTKTKK